MLDLKRREFITLLGGAAAAWPLAVRAQQPGKLPTIGFLGAASASSWSPWVAAFVQRLRELGWIEGRNIAIDYRWAEGRTERMAEIAAEFVRLKVDVIVTDAFRDRRLGDLKAEHQQLAIPRGSLEPGGSQVRPLTHLRWIDAFATH